MVEDALIRLTNLRQLEYTPSDLVRLIGHTYPYWRDLLAGKKSFGEKAARKIESKLGLPRGCLDRVDGVKSRRETGGGPATANEPSTPYNTLSDLERALLNNFSVLPEEDQADFFAEIELRAMKARAHIAKVLREMGLDPAIRKSNDLARGTFPKTTAEHSNLPYADSPGSAVPNGSEVVKPGDKRSVPTPTLDMENERHRREGKKYGRGSTDQASAKRDHTRRS